MKKILLVLALVGMIGGALLTSPIPAAATCTFTVANPTCSGACVVFTFGYSGTGTVDLQKKVGTNWVTVATNITSGYVYCPPAGSVGPVTYRFKGTCSDGRVSYGYPGAIACP